MVYPALSMYMYKQCWVNCTIHTQLKHASHQSCLKHSSQTRQDQDLDFLSMCAASLIHPRKVTQLSEVHDLVKGI